MRALEAFWWISMLFMQFLVLNIMPAASYTICPTKSHYTLGETIEFSFMYKRRSTNHKLRFKLDSDSDEEKPLYECMLLGSNSKEVGHYIKEDCDGKANYYQIVTLSTEFLLAKFSVSTLVKVSVDELPEGSNRGHLEKEMTLWNPKRRKYNGVVKILSTSFLEREASMNYYDKEMPVILRSSDVEIKLQVKKSWGELKYKMKLYRIDDQVYTNNSCLVDVLVQKIDLSKLLSRDTVYPCDLDMSYPSLKLNAFTLPYGVIQVNIMMKSVDENSESHSIVRYFRVKPDQHIRKDHGLHKITRPNADEFTWTYGKRLVLSVADSFIPLFLKEAGMNPRNEIKYSWTIKGNKRTISRGKKMTLFQAHLNDKSVKQLTVTCTWNFRVNVFDEEQSAEIRKVVKLSEEALHIDIKCLRNCQHRQVPTIPAMYRADCTNCDSNDDPLDFQYNWYMTDGAGTGRMIGEKTKYLIIMGAAESFTLQVDVKLKRKEIKENNATVTNDLTGYAKKAIHLGKNEQWLWTTLAASPVPDTDKYDITMDINPPSTVPESAPTFGFLSIAGAGMHQLEMCTFASHLRNVAIYRPAVDVTAQIGVQNARGIQVKRSHVFPKINQTIQTSSPSSLRIRCMNAKDGSYGLSGLLAIAHDIYLGGTQPGDEDIKKCYKYIIPTLEEAPGSMYRDAFMIQNILLYKLQKEILDTEKFYKSLDLVVKWIKFIFGTQQSTKYLKTLASYTLDYVLIYRNKLINKVLKEDIEQFIELEDAILQVVRKASMFMCRIYEIRDNVIEFEPHLYKVETVWSDFSDENFTEVHASYQSPSLTTHVIISRDVFLETLVILRYNQTAKDNFINIMIFISEFHIHPTPKDIVAYGSVNIYTELRSNQEEFKLEPVEKPIEITFEKYIEGERLKTFQMVVEQNEENVTDSTCVVFSVLRDTKRNVSLSIDLGGDFNYSYDAISTKYPSEMIDFLGRPFKKAVNNTFKFFIPTVSPHFNYKYHQAKYIFMIRVNRASGIGFGGKGSGKYAPEKHDEETKHTVERLTEVKMRMFQTKCYYLTEKGWKNDLKCQVNETSSKNEVICNCYIHAPVSAKRISYFKNYRDFETLELDFYGPTLIPASLVVLCVTLFIFYSFHVMFQDIKEKENAHTHVVKDLYNPRSTHQYLICIQTSIIPGTGTDHRVSFLLVGNTGSLTTAMPDGNFCYSAGSEIWFLVSSDLDIGYISGVIVNYDKYVSGANLHPWGLKGVIVYSLSHNHVIVLKANHLLGLHMPSIVLPTVPHKYEYGGEMMVRFKRLIQTYHILGSVFFHKPGNGVNRMLCGLALVFVITACFALGIEVVEPPQPRYHAHKLAKLDTERSTKLISKLSLLTLIVSVSIKVLFKLIFRKHVCIRWYSRPEEPEGYWKKEYPTRSWLNLAIFGKGPIQSAYKTWITDKKPVSDDPTQLPPVESEVSKTVSRTASHSKSKTLGISGSSYTQPTITERGSESDLDKIDAPRPPSVAPSRLFQPPPPPTKSGSLLPTFSMHKVAKNISQMLVSPSKMEAANDLTQISSANDPTQKNSANDSSRFNTEHDSSKFNTEHDLTSGIVTGEDTTEKKDSNLNRLDSEEEEFPPSQRKLSSSSKRRNVLKGLTESVTKFVDTNGQIRQDYACTSSQASCSKNSQYIDPKHVSRETHTEATQEQLTLDETQQHCKTGIKRDTYPHHGYDILASYHDGDNDSLLDSQETSSSYGLCLPRERQSEKESELEWDTPNVAKRSSDSYTISPNLSNENSKVLHGLHCPSPEHSRSTPLEKQADGGRLLQPPEMLTETMNDKVHIVTEKTEYSSQTRVMNTNFKRKEMKQNHLHRYSLNDNINTDVAGSSMTPQKSTNLQEKHSDAAVQQTKAFTSFRKYYFHPISKKSTRQQEFEKDAGLEHSPNKFLRNSRYLDKMARDYNLADVIHPKCQQTSTSSMTVHKENSKEWVKESDIKAAEDLVTLTNRRCNASTQKELFVPHSSVATENNKSTGKRHKVSRGASHVNLPFGYLMSDSKISSSIKLLIAQKKDHPHQRLHEAHILPVRPCEWIGRKLGRLSFGVGSHKVEAVRSESSTQLQMPTSRESNINTLQSDVEAQCNDSTACSSDDASFSDSCRLAYKVGSSSDPKRASPHSALNDSGPVLDKTSISLVSDVNKPHNSRVNTGGQSKGTKSQLSDIDVNRSALPDENPGKKKSLKPPQPALKSTSKASITPSSYMQVSGSNSLQQSGNPSIRSSKQNSPSSQQDNPSLPKDGPITIPPLWFLKDIHDRSEGRPVEKKPSDEPIHPYVLTRLPIEWLSKPTLWLDTQRKNRFNFCIRFFYKIKDFILSLWSIKIYFIRIPVLAACVSLVVFFTYHVILNGRYYSLGHCVQWMIVVFAALAIELLILEPLVYLGGAFFSSQMWRTPSYIHECLNRFKSISEIIEYREWLVEISLAGRQMTAFCHRTAAPESASLFHLHDKIWKALKNVIGQTAVTFSTGVYWLIIYTVCTLILVNIKSDIANCYRQNANIMTAFGLPEGTVEVTNVDDMWFFIEHTLRPGLLLLMGSRTNLSSRNDMDKSTVSPMYTTMLALPVRIRQLRNKNLKYRGQICSPVPNLEIDPKRQCNEDFTIEKMETHSFGISWRDRNDIAGFTNEFKHTDEEINLLANIDFFPSCGYDLLLDVERKDALSFIGSTRLSDWIDEGTRYIVVDFTVINVDTYIVNSYRVVFDFKRPVLFRYVTGFHFPLEKRDTSFYIMLAVGIFFIFISAHNVFTELVKIYKDGVISYFTNISSYMEIAKMCLSSALLLVYWKKSILMKGLLTEVDKTFTLPGKEIGFINFYEAAVMDLIYRTTGGFLAFICIFQMFDMLKKINRLLVFIRLLRNAVYLFLQPLITGMSFAFLSMMLFGRTSQNFSTFHLAYLMVNQYFIKPRPIFHSLVENHPYLGQAFYFVLGLCVNFFVVNFFIAFLNEAYSSIMNQVRIDNYKVKGKSKLEYLYEFLGIQSTKTRDLEEELLLQERAKENLFLVNIKRLVQ